LSQLHGIIIVVAVAVVVVVAAGVVAVVVAVVVVVVVVVAVVAILIEETKSLKRHFQMIFTTYLLARPFAKRKLFNHLKPICHIILVLSNHCNN